MRNNVYSDIMLIQGYAITCIWKKENFQNFMYNIYDKLWGDDITNSLIWIFIRTGQEMFSEKIWNFKMSQLPYFLSDFHHFCTNLWGNFYSFFWNYVNSGLDFPFKAVGPVYRRVIPYARKRTHFTSRKVQGEIPVNWLDSTNRQLYSGGEAYMGHIY